MSQLFQEVQNNLLLNPKLWLITGVAGFIGSNLLEYLLNLNQRVIGLDNFVTGKQSNLDEIEAKLSVQQWSNFSFFQADVSSLDVCYSMCEGVDYILHQAALCSVSASISDPVLYHTVNATGFLNLLMAARDQQVSSLTYATTSAAYGDCQSLPLIEDNEGKLLSMYAVTKIVNETYANFFARTYGVKSVGLRYFNVFGQRQASDGAYAAVIPKWISAMIKGEDLCIYGDGETSRDFCHIDNVIQANILAATKCQNGKNDIYNVALNESTSLNQLVNYLRRSLLNYGISYTKDPIYCDFRQGDVRYSQADISKAKQYLGYNPTVNLQYGLQKTMSWYVNNI